MPGGLQIVDDFRLTLRKLRGSPGYTAAAVLTLALAIGVNTAIFSIADAVLFRPLPFGDADRLQVIRMLDAGTGARYNRVDNSVVEAIERAHTGVSGVAILESGPSLLVPGSEGARRIPAVMVTPNYFDVLGVETIRGRTFNAEDVAAGGRTALLSYGFWVSELAADEDIVGTTLDLGETTLDVVGVLPPDLLFVSVFGDDPDVVTVMAPPAAGDEGGVFYPIVRLEDGATREQAQAQLEALASGLVLPEQTRPVLDDVRSVLYSAGGPMMRYMLVASMLVLLLGCANLANLLLVRGRRREIETGIRAALGASQARLVGPIILEALLVALMGSLLALVATSSLFDLLLSQVPPVAYGAAPVGVDGRVLLFAVALALVAALLFAAVPALRAAKTDVRYLIRRRMYARVGPGRSFIGRPMVALQVALALVLLSGAAMAGRAFLSVASRPLGFEPKDVAYLAVSPPAGVQGMDARAFYSNVVRTLRERSDVAAAGASGTVPILRSAPWSGVPAEPGSETTVAGLAHVLPGYFEAAGIALLRGRFLTDADVQSGAAVAVIEESAERVLFPDGRDAVGRSFRDFRDRLLTVVGVVEDVLTVPTGEAQPLVYAIPDDRVGPMAVLVRVRGANASVLADLRRAVAPLAPGRTVSATWWADAISRNTAYRNPRFQTIVLGGFALLALALTALGVFGVVAFLVTARTHEVGIRLALGGTPRSIIALLVRQSFSPVAIGLPVGLVLTRLIASLAASQLFEVDTRDPAALALATSTVLVAALLAAFIPARRASRIEPVIAQRAE